ncbi:alpha/beta fold hydrolase [Nocardioides albidus]|uniref:Alpha/beta fold hydrolase n=1 Tax=Nocardioides albidus TaxID=1517589 RepID=A0A5C4W452_9ACTN|nr:alpha/beta hydrolase [Nocardioides albidus]TNM42823.1 alpha/beta fold hydrolase [Nocardioides albidus]
MAPALEVHDLGDGVPLLMIQTGLTADELLPLALSPDLADYRRLVLHRRGYAGSASPHDQPSIAAESCDCVELLDDLGLERAHVLGYSYSAAIALDLAVAHSDRVASLVLLEPPPSVTVHRAAFLAVVAELVDLRREQGVAAALEAFVAMQAPPAWWAALERDVPDAREQMLRDAATFFDRDLPALCDWTFGDAEATRVACPVLHVGGDASGPWWAAVRKRVLGWFPGAADVVVPGADHGLAVTHAAAVAAAISLFLDGLGG